MMSSALPDTDGLPAAPRAGADLRAARERLGWPIEEVSHALRIRLPHLEALEEGRIDLLPGNAYAVGFLRTYAKTLGLDPEEISRRFKAEASEVNRRTELVFPAPVPQRGVPAGAVVLLGAVLAIVAYAGWYRLSGDGRLPAETVAPVPQRLATLAEQAAPPAPPAGAAKLAGAQAAAQNAGTPGGAPLASAAGSPTPSAGTAPVAAASAPPAGEPATGSPTSAFAAPVPPAAPAATPAPATTAAAASIMLQATADTWLEVRDHGGTILLNKVLHRGDSWPVPAEAGLTLTTGNAGGTEIVVDGVAYSVPGGSGAVRHNIPLDVGLITSGELAPSGSSGQGGVMPVSATRPAGQ